jgi:hypothetical protein
MTAAQTALHQKDGEVLLCRRWRSLEHACGRQQPPAVARRAEKRCTVCPIATRRRRAASCRPERHSAVSGTEMLLSCHGYARPAAFGQEDERRRGARDVEVAGLGYSAGVRCTGDHRTVVVGTAEGTAERNGVAPNDQNP